MPAFIAKGAGKAVGEDTAREILAKIMFHIGGHGIAIKLPVCVINPRELG
jgi:hypothetical protein